MYLRQRSTNDPFVKCIDFSTLFLTCPAFPFDENFIRVEIARTSLLRKRQQRGRLLLDPSEHNSFRCSLHAIIRF